MEYITQEQFNEMVRVHVMAASRKPAPMWTSFDDWISLGDAVAPVIERLRDDLDGNGGQA